MKSFVRLVASERLKLSKSFIWLLVPLSPLLALAIGLLVSFDSYDISESQAKYAMLVSAMSSFHSMLFLPILTGIFSAFVCRYEHGSGGWKQLLTLPISRTALYCAKFIVVATLIALTQLLFFGAVCLAGAYHGISFDIEWAPLLMAIGGSFLACLPLAALQLLVSVSWSSFAAPLAINVMLTIPNILVLNSAKIAPFYPWAQPMLTMLTFSNDSFNGSAPTISNMLITIAGSFFVFWAAGLLYFNRKEV
ncbi:hypothetical protein FHS15_003300 [Paenibacillus castaneae]|uniref:ABC transporter permease n=1 Tax=Paenibacillus castaneae TaxID=474957 RepID=UPI000C9B1013|nr:ABC transporter permease [Paenibacillus castaneae]NIK78162.1 hypothetical protein [Paenibacillus castaneae]